MTSTLTVLYDAGCPLCSRFRDWLVVQPALVPVRLVPAGSAEARALFPSLDHSRTLREITVVGDDGAVWTQEHAWVMCLWATRRFRPLAERLARPGWLPLARGAAATAAGVRVLMGGGGDGYPGACAGTCSPQQG
ncbi:DCC1-like thiol-disulfide oxidoreductase family protein [Nocardioides plantarum]|uniref:DCC1-like thiol-disulfide oxidoreductase family protein n=1 Tax=Nocardioides plantarum TaxID=29299 RepID=A0ABV5K8R1_9ACTN|nr:DCC1-like thiol-disulfide oxidoreductase family protein [Nocardioides plantarum]